MQPADTLRFALHDRIDDVEVGPARVPLAMLGQFQKDVSEFLTGSRKDADPNQVMVAIEKGSLALVASGLLAATGLWSDVDKLHDPLRFGSVDAKRAAVVERWQIAARRNPGRRYSLATHDGTILVHVNVDSDYRNQTTDIWVPVKKYLRGQITDLGGTNKANVHVKLDNGEAVVIASSQQLLASEERNRLYKPAVLHVSAEENLNTGELRNQTLMGFKDPLGTWDEAAFEAMVRKGTQAWADTPDDWLENLRSGQA